jgi:CheY-like chemotaxis protein
MNILIVDDSRFLRLANERALSKAGHQVLTASDGEEGLRLGIEHQPDLIVLDMLLPKLSGPEVLRALRKNLRTATIPIMVLTSLPQRNQDKLLKEGATVYFEKAGLRIAEGSGAFVEAAERTLALANQAKAKATNQAKATKAGAAKAAVV